MSKDLVDFNFECLNYNDYSLEIILEFNHRLLKLIFDKSKNKLKRTKGISFDKSAEDLDNFIVAIPTYNKLIKTSINSVMKNIFQQIKSDGIEILNNEIDKTLFKRNPDNEKEWRAHIMIKGQYLDKR